MTRYPVRLVPVSLWVILCSVGCGGLDTIYADHLEILDSTAAWSADPADSLYDSWRTAWGDWDGDGDLDLAVAKNGSGNLVYENSGGELTLVWSSTETDATVDLAWGDWDGDGDLDLAVANESNQPDRVYENTGGDLVLDWTSSLTENTQAVAWGDWDGDWDLDLATAAWGQPIRVYESDLATLTLAWSSTETNTYSSLAWADWDDDGDPDLAFGANSSPQLGVFENTGGVLSLAYSDAGADAWDIAWADWDGDGDFDLAAARTGASNTVRPFESTTAVAGWSSPDTLVTTGVAWGDWDGDGDPDLAFANWTASPTQVYDNSGGAASLAWSSDEVGPTRTVAWADWDGDAVVDLSAAAEGEDHVYVNDGSALALEWSSPEADPSRVVAWGDWDGDGDPDLAVGNSNATAAGPTPARVYENDGGDLLLAWTSTELESTYGLVWGDWDGDGDLDLIVLNGDGATTPIRIYENTPAGLVSNPTWSVPVSQVDWVGSGSLADYDGDGDLDLATKGGVARVFRNDGGTPTLAWSSSGGVTGWVEWGDYDGDGDPDLAVPRHQSSGLAAEVYRNEGGSFVLAWTAPQVDNAVVARWGDVDADGDLDLAIATSAGTPIRLYLNVAAANPSAPFSGPINTTENDYSADAVWGDWDGDGDLDLAVGNVDEPNRVYKNEGGVLSLAWSTPESDLTYTPAWADVDGDGDLDLAFATASVDPNRLYINHRITAPNLPNNPTYPVLGYPEPAVGPTSPAVAPVGTFTPSGFTGPTITVPFTLFDSESDPAPSVRLEYSESGGGQWFDASVTGSTEFLAASPTGEAHTLDWQVPVGLASDNVVLRLIVEWQSPSFVAYPIQHGEMAATSATLRVWEECFPPDADTDGARCFDDCDDGDPAVHPGALESCDATDSDCDGSLVDGFDDTDADGEPDCVDVDDDGDGDPDTSDCAPLDASVHVAASESCDAIDSDCDGSLVDEFDDTDGDLDPDCTDPDDDGDGDPDASDCALLDAAIYTGAVETCDAIDSDCDGSLVDEFDDTDGDLEPDCTDLDDDADGDPDASDCAPLDASVFTGASEVCDAVDSDCDGSLVDEFDDTDLDLEPDCIDPDDDGDGDPDASDCAPLEVSIYTGAPESCDVVDSDCDGSVVDEFDDTDADLEPDCTDPDDDGDGSLDGDDCEPEDAAVFPGATEFCDATDSDCDGSLVDESTDTDGDGDPDCTDPDDDGDGVDADAGDCDDLDATSYPGAPEVCDGAEVDNDCDSSTGDLLDVDADGFTLCDDDCDDGDDTIYPLAPELCDGLDNDCDPATDEDDRDDDVDGYRLCDDDCDDADPSVYPDAPELCDGLDNDCDEETDEELDFVAWFFDADGDLYGDPAQGHPDGLLCQQPESYVSIGGDCDDNDEAVHPGADDICDGVLDNDCDGATDPLEADDDGDGDSECDGDCDDANDAVQPGAADLCDGVTDNDCDGLPDPLEEDDDGDGTAECGGDCDDDDPEVHPAAEHVCDSIDNDCDDEIDLDGTDVDADGDGVLACSQGGEQPDCDDTDPAAYPGADEVCGDGVDQDCDAAERGDRDDPECWPSGCASSLNPRTSTPLSLASLLMLLPGLLLLRRRRPASQTPRAALPILVLALVVGVVTPGAAAASGEEEGARQLDFARSELADDKPDRALKSAESALRLCPTCYDAMVVKALAYEALGDHKLAESLLLAYVELVGQQAATHEATVHLQRIQAGRSEHHRRSGSKPPETEQVAVTVSPVVGLDPQPYEERVKTALDRGQCRVAQSAASELVLAAPEEAEGWRLAGDAARCSSDMRGAVVAYRRYVDRGGAEASVVEMIDALALNLAVVTVQLELAEGSTVPVVRLDTGKEFLAPFAASDEELRFSDLPVGVPFSVTLAGRGLEAQQHDVPALAPGQTFEIRAAPDWIGLGEIQVSEHAAGLCRTTIYTADDIQVAGPGDRIEVTAGEVVAHVDNENGLLEIPLEVGRDTVVDFAPERHLPASLTVVGLPAGAEVRVFVETSSGDVVEQTASLAADQGEIDDSTGVRLAPPHKFLSLRGGSGGVFVAHPALGDAPASLVLESGSVNAATYPWQALEGVPGVTARYEDWKAEVATARRLQQRTSALGVLSGVLAAAGAGLLVGAAVEDGKITKSRAEGLGATDGMTDEGALEAAWQASLAARQTRNGLLVGGAVSAGLGGVGLVVTFGSARSAREAVAEVGSWDPAAAE